ncbi:MAG TPA: sodium:proton antiporter [Armatimonadetes bacterium]|nr:sodium:proton antiporter [Armatimonadota bacterium]
MHEAELILFLMGIIVAAKIGAELCEWLRQPTVLGEILAGVALYQIPVFREAPEHEAVRFLSEIGVILLLFEVGLESELSQLLKVGGQAVAVACIGVVVPLLAGWVLLHQLGYPWGEALFMGGILTATSVGITARVLRDLNLLRSRSGQVIIGAAVVDDILGLLVLAILVSALAPRSGSPMHPALQVGLAVLFLLGSVFLGMRLAPSLMGLVRRMRAGGTLVVAAVGFCLLLAYTGTLIGMAPIVGAFAAGLVLASTDEKVPIEDKVQPASELFVPVFFVLIGMQIDVTVFNPFNPANHGVLLLALALFAIAVPGKLAAGVGAFGKGIDRWLVGIGMVPRGEVGLIFATIGLQAGLVQKSVYSAAVVALLATTLIVPPWLSRRARRLAKRAASAA